MTAIVIFRFGDVRCALDREAVSEIAPVPELALPPGMPASVSGFLNWRGEVVAVVDASRLFGVPADETIDPLYRHILVVDDGIDRLGLMVDRVEDVRRLEAGQVLEAGAEQTLNDCVVGQIAVGEPNVYLLEPARILLAAERARINELRNAEQARLDALVAL